MIHMHIHTHRLHTHRRNWHRGEQARLKPSQPLAQVQWRWRISQGWLQCCLRSFPRRLRCCLRSRHLELSAVSPLELEFPRLGCTWGLGDSADSRTNTTTRTDSVRRLYPGTPFGCVTDSLGRGKAITVARRKLWRLTQLCQPVQPVPKPSPQFFGSSRLCRVCSIREVFLRQCL